MSTKTEIPDKKNTPAPIPINKNEKKHRSFITKIKFIFTIVSLMIILLSIAAYYIYSIPFTTVIVDANASINLKLNRWYKVIDVSSVDNNGLKLINDVNLKYTSIDDALIIIINKAEANDYIKTDGKASENYPVVVYISGNSVNTPKFYNEAMTKKYDIKINENGVEKFDNLH